MHIHVAAALITAGETVLIQRRVPGGPRGDLWEFPGGKIEPGETPESAVARECREELGVEVRVGPQVFRCEHSYTDLDITLELYAAELLPGAVPKALSAAELRFCPRLELRGLAFCEADYAILDWLTR